MRMCGVQKWLHNKLRTMLSLASPHAIALVLSMLVHNLKWDWIFYAKPTSVCVCATSGDACKLPALMTAPLIHAHNDKHFD